MERRTRTLGRGILALLVITCGVAVVVSLRAAEDRPVPAGLHVGVVANTLDGGPQRQDVVRRAGFGWIREELRWDVLERERGRFDWSSSDALFRAAATRRLRILPLLLGTPAWLGPAMTLPSDPAAFARFSAAAAARYGPGGAFWTAHPRLDPRLAPASFEVWNEPWFRAFSADGIDPARFAVMARDAIIAGRRANPRTRWLVPVEAPYLRDDGQVGDFLDDLHAAVPELGQLADGYAVHPYDVDDPATTNGDRRGQFRRIDDVLAGLRANGWRRRPLWVTEVGWSTCSRRPLCVSEAGQRRHFTSLMRLLRDRYAGTVRAVFAYHLFDPGTPAPRVSGNYFGLIRHDGSRKPAFDVYARAAQRSRR